MGRDAVAFEAPRECRDAGAYRFIRFADDETPSGIIHACPCGCGGATALYFRGRNRNGGQEWSVVGTWPKVTLSPSIGIPPKDAQGRYHWHGFLENGVFVER